MKNYIWKKLKGCLYELENCLFIKIQSRLMKATLFLWVLVTFVFSGSAFAQDQEDTYKPFDGHLSLKNMHMWRGFVVTPGVMTSGSLEYNTKNKKFTLGLWGGASFDGSFKEYSYYAVYRFTDNFYTEVVSHNNYSNMEDPDMFSYDNEVSPNFVDIALGYTISEEVPLKIFWATILGGQAGDYEEDQDGSITNSYSNYLEFKYRVYNKVGYKLSAFAGGAFSFSTAKTFYSDDANFVNIGLTLNRSVEIFSKNIPLEFNGIWNPESGKGVLEINVALF